MAMEYDGKNYRNLMEQVAYLTRFLSANTLANEMGIKVLGRVDTAADLPANDPDDPFEYGDAYMVGEEGHTPYRMSIWTRDAGDGNPGWFDIGYFPTAPDQFSLVEINGQVVHIFYADTKLDKVTSATNVWQAYIKNADGSQGMLNMNTDTMAGAIALRLASGGLKVPLNPVADSDAISKKYADDTFLAKQTGVTSYPQLYGKYADGSQAMIPTTSNAVAGTVLQRQANGQIALPNQNDYPPSDDQSITKRYADAHYGGLVGYIHTIVVDMEYNDGVSNHYGFKVKISVINGSSSPITSLAFANFTSWGMTVEAVEGYDYNTTSTQYFAVQTGYGDGYHHADGHIGVALNFTIPGSPVKEIYVEGTDPNITQYLTSCSIVDTVHNI